MVQLCRMKKNKKNYSSVVCIESTVVTHDPNSGQHLAATLHTPPLCAALRPAPLNQPTYIYQKIIKNIAMWVPWLVAGGSGQAVIESDITHHNMYMCAVHCACCIQLPMYCTCK